MLLLLLLLLPLRSECLTWEKVLAFFPENIASYHPVLPKNELRITALFDSTDIKFMPSANSDHTLGSGEVKVFDIAVHQELDKTNVSDKITVVTSNKDIVVEILSHRNNSIQTAVLLSTDQLGQEYQVPPIPKTEPDLYGSIMSAAVTERSPFRLILVSIEDKNNISLPDGEFVELHDDQVVQLWVYKNMVGKMVTGTKSFMAFFAHPCAIQFNCTCGLLYTPLWPHNSTTRTFIVPPMFSGGSASKVYLLKPSAPTPMELTSGSLARFEESGAVLLQSSGLLMNLIPEEEFGSCFVVHKVEEAEQNWAVIVVPADSTDGVQIGNSPFGGNWAHVPGTNDKYKYSRLELSVLKTVIWHKYGLIAVYFIGRKAQDGNALFGNPAPRLSKDPDHRGCALEPEIMEVLHEEGSWQESIQACRRRDLDLISLSDPILQQQIYNWTLGLNQTELELWMGLRKSSFSGMWYWISKAPLIQVDWVWGSPGGLDEGECARINLKDSNNPGWSHHDCCKKAKAVCYRPPTLLTI